MKKVIMKRVPKNFDCSTQHRIMKNWSSVIVETYAPNQPIKIVSAKEASEIAKKQPINTKEK